VPNKIALENARDPIRPVFPAGKVGPPKSEAFPKRIQRSEYGKNGGEKNRDGNFGPRFRNNRFLGKKGNF
jgi:hypothetical protein